MIIEQKDLLCLDPYDPWMTAAGVKIKDWFYQGKLQGKGFAVLVAVADWLAPKVSRSLMGATPKYYPITVAQWISAQHHLKQLTHPKEAYELLMQTATPEGGPFVRAWGLGFPWMSKNGLYADNVPFVTHTPYAMDALLKLATYPEVAPLAQARFDETLQFLDSLLVMHETDEHLVLSYAPIEEPRMVVNANSYAAWSYALHAQGLASENEAGNLSDTSAPTTDSMRARQRAIKLTRWVLAQQNADGSWHYYADRDPGNFIDCFHSCFVLKNLLKVCALIPELDGEIQQAVSQGISYIDKDFLDNKTGLVKRFVERDIKDPFVWDLYDQAEYLGVLLDLGRVDEAKSLHHRVHKHFSREGRWYARSDFLGRLWGERFYRWGIVPYYYQWARLQSLTMQ